MKIKKVSFRIFAIILMCTVTVGCLPTPTPTPTPTPEIIPCVGFREYAVSHNFGNPWEKIGFIFTSNLQLVIRMGVNNINGLAIEDSGLRVELPGVVENITIQAMAMGNIPITIDGLDGSKNTVDQVLVPDDDTLHVVHLSAEEISTVIFTGGDNEALLIEICKGDFYTP